MNKDIRKKKLIRTRRFWKREWKQLEKVKIQQFKKVNQKMKMEMLA